MYYISKMAKRTKKPSEYFASSRRQRKASDQHLISVRLSDDLMQRLATVGNEEGMSMSDTIRLVLELGLIQRGQRRTS